MFKPVKATSVDEYLSMLAPERKEPIMFLHKHIQQLLPEATPHFAYNMLGYGSFKYKNYKKEVIDWPIISLASQKNYISLYVCCVADGEYIAEKYKEKLGKVSVGKSCIRFKKLEDIQLKAIDELLLLAFKHPGFEG